MKKLVIVAHGNHNNCHFMFKERISRKESHSIAKLVGFYDSAKAFITYINPKYKGSFINSEALVTDLKLALLDYDFSLVRLNQDLEIFKPSSEEILFRYEQESLVGLSTY